MDSNTNVVDSLTETVQDMRLSSPEMSSDEDGGQDGNGIDFLGKAMDLAERGHHDDAWDSLHFARQVKAPRPLIKKAEAYCSQLRDTDE